LVEEWTQWTACDVSCGTGTTTRSYVCENAPEELGQIPECIGDGRVREEKSCDSGTPCRMYF